MHMYMTNISERRDEEWIEGPEMDPAAQIAEVVRDADPENTIGSALICNRLPMLK